MTNHAVKYKIEHLNQHHQKQNFDCGVEPLDVYLKTRANQDMKKNAAVTHVLTLLDSQLFLPMATIEKLNF